MRKFITIILMIVSLVVLVSCSKDNDVPEGLQLVEENKELGYTFYAPEGWTVSSRGGISAAYVTPINITSITFTEADAPSVPLTQYFDESMATLPYEISVIKRDEKCLFGNSSDAYKYIYSYKYQDFDFSCMQILVHYGERFFIFTYNSYGKVDDAESDYSRYLESVQLSIDNFKFTQPQTDVGTDSATDGEFVLVSDRALAGFDLYIPNDYTVVDNGAMVTAKISQSANISLTKASQTGISVLDYLRVRREELSHIVTGIKDIKIGVPKDVVESNPDYFEYWPMDVLPTQDGEMMLGDLSYGNTVCYEYTYEFAGRAYHVYQVLGVDGYSGYVFTYTATEDEYAKHLDEIRQILEKVRF